MAIADVLSPTLFILVLKEFKKFFDPTEKGYSLIIGGATLSITAGIGKVVWKFLYALSICDFQILSKMFFPLAMTAYWCMGIGIHMYMNSKKHKGESLNAVSAVAVPVFTSNMPFILGSFIGSFVLYSGLVRVGIKVKSKKAVIFTVLSFLSMMANSVLSSKFDNSGIMHWIAQCANYSLFAFMLLAMKQVNKINSQKETT